MLFNDFAYFLFLAAVLGVLRLLQRAGVVQRLFLLAASNLFYGYWDYRFLALLWVSITVDYAIGRALGRGGAPRTRKLLVAASVAANLAILSFFKYFNFFQEGFASLMGALGIPFSPLVVAVTLPVGISFYTFQSMSYSIDVYRGRIEPCRSLLGLALFVSFFPQLVAGPIERAGRLLPQLLAPLRVRSANVMSGVLLIIWGLFKKAVGADLAGTFLVDPIFNHPQHGLMLWLAAVAFGFQIYLDFSGYCDIARGTARCMGVELMENFHAPYFARNITDFWRRWHISLSTWFRDYLYIPLGGNRRGRLRTYLNLAATMLLCGLWHGAAAPFVVWGAFHGVLLMAHRALGLRGRERRGGAAGAALSWAACFAAVTFSWMLFRVESFNLARNAAMMFGAGEFLPPGLAPVAALVLSLAVLGLVVVAAHLVQLAARRGRELEHLFPSAALTGVVFGVLVLAVLVFGSLREDAPFIYFQF